MHIFITDENSSAYKIDIVNISDLHKRTQLNCWCLLCRRIRQDSRCAFLTTMNHHNPEPIEIPAGLTTDSLCCLETASSSLVEPDTSLSNK